MGTEWSAAAAGKAEAALWEVAGEVFLVDMVTESSHPTPPMPNPNRNYGKDAGWHDPGARTGRGSAQAL